MQEDTTRGERVEVSLMFISRGVAAEDNRSIHRDLSLMATFSMAGVASAGSSETGSERRWQP